MGSLRRESTQGWTLYAKSCLALKIVVQRSCARKEKNMRVWREIFPGWEKKKSLYESKKSLDVAQRENAVYRQETTEKIRTGLPAKEVLSRVLTSRGRGGLLPKGGGARIPGERRDLKKEVKEE